MATRVSTVKHAQKEAQVMREISNFFLRILYDEKRLFGLYVTRASLSPDKGMCTVFFHTSGGQQDFEEKRPVLILYKPSLRTALSKSLYSRYVPDLVFKYDAPFDKQRKVEDLMDRLKSEGKL